jgi:hypothetical protein
LRGEISSGWSWGRKQRGDYIIPTNLFLYIVEPQCFHGMNYEMRMNGTGKMGLPVYKLVSMWLLVLIAFRSLEMFFKGLALRL